MSKDKDRPQVAPKDQDVMEAKHDPRVPFGAEGNGIGGFGLQPLISQSKLSNFQ